MRIFDAQTGKKWTSMPNNYITLLAGKFIWSVVW